MRVSLFVAAIAWTASFAVKAADQPAGYDQYGLGQSPCAIGQSSSNGQQTPFLSAETLSNCPEALQPVYPFNKISLRAPDDSIRASFIPFGSRMTEFWTRDRSGTLRDVLLGLDNTTTYAALANTTHPYFGPQVGRYANRIKNGTFELDGKTFHTPLNENNISTLHGGTDGYDQRHYTIETLRANHVSFVMRDHDGNQGFPGTVVARNSYTLLNDGELHIAMDANITDNKKTPVMLSHHGYWALHGYKDANNTILNHTLHLPKADEYIETDGILIPTGKISKVKGTPLDFETPRTFQDRFNETQGQCGTGCQGWDNCIVMSKAHPRHEHVLALTSPETGIRLRVSTDQTAFQVYTCNGVQPKTGPSIPRKFSHGGDASQDKVYENHSCVVLEMQDYIDAINNPSFKRDQIYSR